MEYTPLNTQIRRVSTGSQILDVLLEGGLEKDVITTVYGPSGSGKTNFCMITAISIAKKGKKVIYVDSEGGFSVERMKQIDPDFENTIKNIQFLQPTTFQEQKNIFMTLNDMIKKDVGLIVVDTISMLYRLEMGKMYDVAMVNQELMQQLWMLTDITRKKTIPILIANQVYADFTNRDNVKMVGGDILKYSSKCLIELTRGNDGERRAVLKKHRSIPEESEVKIRIVNSGIEESKN